MAVAPPFNLVVQKVPTAINKLQGALNKLIDRLNEKISDAISDASKLSERIDCSDPRVQKIKSTLQSIQQIIQKIQEVLRILQIVVPALTVAATIAAALINIQLGVPVPSPPALVQALALQNELIATIIGALKQASIIITVVNGGVILASAGLAAVINKLSSICNDEVFEVTAVTQLAINELNTELNTEFNNYAPSEFYNVKNTSIDDLDNRELLIQQLNSKQLSIIDNLLELPSKVIRFRRAGTPDENIGKQGDFAINETTKTFYGPKVSDTDWGMGINY
jgi:hypothetical protein